MATLTVYASTADNDVKSTEDIYATARAGGILAAGAAGGGSSTVGQDFTPGKPGFYDIWEAFESFDTSSLGASATVSAAALTLTSSADSSVTDFTIQARIHDWGAVVETADWVAGASLSGKTLVATHATSAGWTAGTGYEFTDVALPANVNKTGTTYILLNSSRHQGNNAPTGDEFIQLRTADYTGTASDPKLVVTYTSGGSPTSRAQII